MSAMEKMSLDGIIYSTVKSTMMMMSFKASSSVLAETKNMGQAPHIP
jgi:hypothetical protein